MKTKELIKYFEDEGYEAMFDAYFDKGVLFIDKNYGTLLCVLKGDRIDTDYCAFNDLDSSKKQEYYKVIFEYLMTPPEEREEEKRYYLKLKGFSSEEETYLCAYDFWSDWILIDKDELKHGDEFYFKFTQKQIDEMPECYTHPAVWEKIKVERED